MKKLIIGCFVALLATTFVTVPVSAHTLARDGSVGAVLHISPNDDPVAGESAIIRFSVSDSKKSFSPADCACSLTITQASKQLIARQLDSSIATVYTFPETGLYELTLAGTSKSNRFQPFSISQSIRITSSGSTSQSQPIMQVVYALVLSILLGAIVIATLQLYRRRATTPDRERKYNNKKG